MHFTTDKQWQSWQKLKYYKKNDIFKRLPNVKQIVEATLKNSLFHFPIYVSLTREGKTVEEVNNACGIGTSLAFSI
jgi:hypothetical protein